MNSGYNAKTKQSDEYETPQWVFDSLDSEFGFTLDGAARLNPVTINGKDGEPPIVLSKPNNKLQRFSTMEAPFSWTNERVFCNPPYSNIEHFIKLAALSSLAVFLLPVRTDSDWHRDFTERRIEMRYWRKRICFLENGVEQTSPRFASVIAVVKR